MATLAERPELTDALRSFGPDQRYLFDGSNVVELPILPYVAAETAKLVERLDLWSVR